MPTVQHGDKVWTPARTLPGVRHYGIWDKVNGAFIHNTLPGGVQFTEPNEFINGALYVEKRAAPGFEEYVVARARALLGRNYDLLAFNCEHLANYAAEGRTESPQLQNAVLGTTVLAGLWLLFGRGSAPSYDASVDRYRDSNGRFASR